MIRPARTQPSSSPTSGAALRRRAPVIVRAPGKSSSVEVSAVDRRKRRPTLSGVGCRPEADTLPILEVATELEFYVDVDVEVDEPPAPPISLIRARPPQKVPSRAPAPVRIPKAAAVPANRSPDVAPRVRPVTLLDDVHDGLSRRYLEEAERILASGALRRG